MAGYASLTPEMKKAIDETIEAPHVVPESCFEEVSAVNSDVVKVIDTLLHQVMAKTKSPMIRDWMEEIGYLIHEELI